VIVALTSCGCSLGAVVVGMMSPMMGIPDIRRAIMTGCQELSEVAQGLG